jgi:hypothetical protein
MFQNSIALFLEELTEEEKVHFKQASDASGMMQDLILHCSKAKDKSKLLASCKLIDRFARRWEPFFEIVNIVIQSHPEFATIAWGAVRLTFMVTFPSWSESSSCLSSLRI